jgi:hypothetical protein
LPLWKFTYEKSKKLAVTGIAWNHPKRSSTKPKTKPNKAQNETQNEAQDEAQNEARRSPKRRPTKPKTKLDEAQNLSNRYLSKACSVKYLEWQGGKVAGW